MAGTFIVGETKIRPGTYFNIQKVGENQIVGASDGVVAIFFKSDFGPLAQAVEITPEEGYEKLYGTTGSTNAIREVIRAGATKCVCVRVGKGGTAATVTLDKDGDTEALKITAKYPGAKDFAITVREKLSDSSLKECITRVKVIGQEDDDGKSAVEAVLNGSTKYGVRQKIVRRGTDESLEDAKTSAQTILDEEGKVQEEMTVKAPDIPWVRKGDLVHVTVGTMNAYYYVIGIRHDVDSRSMTLDLHVPFKEYEKKAQQTVQKKSYNVGDIVNFHGGTHYVSSYAGSRGYNARAGRAKITIKNGSGKAHPWHLIHVDSSSNVYGWVDDGTFD